MRKQTLPSDDVPLTTAVLVEVCGLEREARTLAVQSLPAADDEDLTKAQSAVVEIVRQRIDKRHRALTEKLLGIKSDLNAAMERV